MPKILDNLLSSAMIFALSFLWVYYSLKSAVWAVTLAAVIAVCSSYVTWRAQSKLYSVQNLKRQKKKDVLSMCDFFKFNADNFAVFAPMYSYYGYRVTKQTEDDFVAEKDGTATLVAVRFENDSLKQSDVIKAILAAKRLNAHKLCIYCAKADSSMRKCAQNHFDTQFADAENTYRLLSDCGKLPSFPKCKRVSNGFAASYAFNKKRFGWYFGASVFMCAVSCVAYFKYYSLGWATVMLFLSMYSLLNTKYNAKQTCLTL